MLCILVISYDWLGYRGVKRANILRHLLIIIYESCSVNWGAGYFQRDSEPKLLNLFRESWCQSKSWWKPLKTATGDGRRSRYFSNGSQKPGALPFLEGDGTEKLETVKRYRLPKTGKLNIEKDHGIKYII